MEKALTSTSSVCWTAANLVDGKPDGLHVFALPPFLPAVLLHEANQEAAVWLAGSVWVLQHKLELRVEPKGCWKEEVRLLLFFGVFFF